MAMFIHNREELEQQLVMLRTRQGWAIRALARHFGLSRNMVRRILRKHDELRDEGHDLGALPVYCTGLTRFFAI
jgi:transposase